MEESITHPLILTDLPLGCSIYRRLGRSFGWLSVDGVHISFCQELQYLLLLLLNLFYLLFRSRWWIDFHEKSWSGGI